MRCSKAPCRRWSCCRPVPPRIARATTVLRSKHRASNRCITSEFPRTVLIIREKGIRSRGQILIPNLNATCERQRKTSIASCPRPPDYLKPLWWVIALHMSPCACGQDVAVNVCIQLHSESFCTHPYLNALLPTITEHLPSRPSLFLHCPGA